MIDIVFALAFALIASTIALVVSLLSVRGQGARPTRWFYASYVLITVPLLSGTYLYVTR